jgi:hypothetical protein
MVGHASVGDDTAETEAGTTRVAARLLRGAVPRGLACRAAVAANLERVGCGWRCAVRWVKPLLSVLLITALGLAGWELFRRSVYPSVGYCVEVRFATAPADDRALCQWLKAQPGVVPHTVHIGREGPDKHVLRVMFIQSRNLAGNPPFPDLVPGCHALGYNGPEFTFQNSTDRSVSGSVCD